VLSGLGGDEAFAGYSTFKFSSHLDHLRRRFPWAATLSPGAQRFGHWPPPVVRSQWWWRVPLGVAGAYPSIIDQYWLIRCFFEPSAAQQLVARRRPPGRAPDAADMMRAEQEHALSASGPMTPIDQIMALELQGYLRHTLLPDADLMSMAHSIELRVPLLDPRVIRLVSELPPALRQGPMFLSKRLLIAAFSDMLPTAVVNARKRGFALPLPLWMRRGPVRDIVEDCLSREVVLRRGLLSPEAVAREWHAFLKRPAGLGNQGQLWLRVWMLTVLELWARHHLDAPAGAPATTACSTVPTAVS
jgi:asparagine synthase (glutamine-hydrolysing)